MSRPTLSLARTKPRTKPPLALVKKALRLFMGRGVPKAVYRRNALAWLAARASLGDHHILNKNAPAKWGRPGDPVVRQVFAPRRLGGS